jgi:AhpC/TSA family
MKQIIKAFIISTVIAVLLTAFTYNIPKIINSNLGTDIFWDMPQRFFYLFITYFLLFVFYYRQFKLEPATTMLITVIPVILLDASVLITYPALVPYRFPISSIFPVLGAVMGIFYVSKKIKSVVIMFIAYVITSFTINHVLMPGLLYNSGNNPKVYTDKNINLQHLTLTNSKNERFELTDLLAQKKITLLDFYFVGCATCINKKASLETIQATLKSEQAGVLFICDGRASKYEKFVADAKGSQDMYYDSTGAVLKLISPSTHAYPYEVIMNAAGHIYADFSGFDTESKTIYENETIKKLNTYLLYADSGLLRK